VPLLCLLSTETNWVSMRFNMSPEAEVFLALGAMAINDTRRELPRDTYPSRRPL